MRTLRLVVLAALVASAEPARAELQVFQGTFSLQGFGGPAPAGSAVGVATVNGSGGGSHLATLQLPGGLFSIHTDVVVTGGTLPITGVEVDLTLGAATLGVGPGGTLSGVMPVPGNVRICVLLNCLLNFDVPLTQGGTRGVGIGGGAIVEPLGVLGTLSLLGAPWQTGNAIVQTSVGSVALTGFAHGPLSQTSSTADPQGALQLVTPVAVGVSQGGGDPIILPIFGLLEVKLLPEPDSFAMLAAGGAALALLGARRTRR